VKKEHLALYQQSPNWKDGQFRNLEETTLSMGLYKIPGLIYKQLKGRKDRDPDQSLPIVPFDKEAFLSPADHMKFIWYGHAVVLMRMNHQTILIDPMLGPNASPIAPFATKRFSTQTLDLIEQFPAIDLLIMTHDHYDHLDYDSIHKLKSKTKKYFVGLGVKRHLVEWGVEADLVTEFDWWNTQIFEDIVITYTPTRHFSGRGLSDRAKSLWGGWVFKTKTESIWFSGDGGYGKHFSAIGQKLGPFDFAFMECGQYNELWHQIHVFPEESVQAAIDAGAKIAMPVHWGAFTLAQHHWTDPAERFVKEAEQKHLNYLLPRLGEIMTPESRRRERWWKEY
jgi:L-ascorbate metabolism protein UlaG (beta-lactamase superfamily)